MRDGAAEAAARARHGREQARPRARARRGAAARRGARGARARIARLQRRREQLGPVNPLAQDEYAEALAHVEELETQRADLETALRELQALIADTDRQIREPSRRPSRRRPGTSRRSSSHALPRRPRPPAPGRRGHRPPARARRRRAPDAASRPRRRRGRGGADEAEQADSAWRSSSRPPGSRPSACPCSPGGEKSLTALAFLFSVFLARPCPFYILDEVEAALDDLNIDRFLALVRRYAGRAQFIVVTHQKRTMEAADVLYGVSMGDDGVSKVVSRKLPKAA